MFKNWLILSLLPIVGFSAQAQKDLFSFSETSEDCLSHFAFDHEDEVVDSFDVSGDSLSLLEIDERDESLIPWSAEDLASEDLSSFMETRAKEVHDDYEDVFAYEMPSYREGVQYEPTYESVPAEKRKLFNRPRVVQSCPKVKRDRKDKRVVEKSPETCQRDS